MANSLRRILEVFPFFDSRMMRRGLQRTSGDNHWKPIGKARSPKQSLCAGTHQQLARITLAGLCFPVAIDATQCRPEGGAFLHDKMD
jgi:hypothetical protein